MKTIGLIGGMSWESSTEYYRTINREVRKRLGGQHSAKLVLYSVDFEEMVELQKSGGWELAGEAIVKAAKVLENAGADFILLCTNTMHKVAPAIESALSVPLVHIVDATGERLKSHSIKKVGLLGTLFTMEEEFYKGRIREKFGVECLVPSEADRKIVHRVIYKELCAGTFSEESRKEFIRIVEDLSKSGAEGVILGCTEIGLLINPSHSSVPLFDTTVIHAEKAVVLSLS